MNAKDFKAEMAWLNSSDAKKNAVQRLKPMRFQNSKSVSHTLIYPDSKYKLILIRSAKQLGKCFSQRAQIHGRTHS